MVYVGDISTVNEIINQPITWGAPPCHFMLFFIFPWIMCLRPMVHCTAVLCLMKPCVLVSFFSVRCTTCCWWYCHWYWSICVCFSEFHWKSRFKNASFCNVNCFCNCLTGTSMFARTALFMFADKVYISLSNLRVSQYFFVWWWKNWCIIISSNYVSRHITTYILKLATKGWNV